jgi:energy-coupling factor transport system permease protein
MTGFVDLYTEGNTFLHRMDPRVKILSVLFLSALALIVGSLQYLLMLLAFILLMLALGRAKLAKTFFALKLVLRVMVLIVILWPFFNPTGTHVLFEYGIIKITEEGVVQGIAVAVRIACLASVWYILMFTTTQRDLVRALVKLGLRFDFGLTLSIALRFLPTFGAMVESIRDAQRARGMEFDKGSLIKRSKNYVAVLVPTIVSALRTADTLSLALQSRAYGARKDRTYLRDLRMRASDYVALALFGLALGLPAFAKYVLQVHL